MDPVPIAIVGMSCRLPGGANSPEQLWDMLERGHNAWTDVPKDRFRWESFYHPDSELPNATNHRGGHFLDQDVAAFDAKFFGIASHEAEAMDPQQRMLIELAYEALENAGIPRESVGGSLTGVYTAIFNHDYERILTHDIANLPKTFLTGNALCMLANKISYLLDLKGPSILVDTACSGSLVAIHQACQALRTYEIETAIAGAANLILDPDVTVAMSDSHFLNGDGRSYSFEARGEGYGRGEGIGIVILKRLTDALRDGDAIRAVIRNTGLGQDGKTAGITLPSAEAQASLIESVYARASLDPRDTGYVEAHGTGTVAGDYAELGTISKIFSGRESGAQKCVHVGSIKANIGHTESTSGVAGLIKAALVVEKGVIPPNPPIEELKPNMLPEKSAVVIPQKATQWPSDVHRASINSFGFGGTNAHCILESANFINVAGIRAEGAAQPHVHPTKVENTITNITEKHLPVQIQTQFLLPISANSQKSLLRTIENIKQWAETGVRPRDNLRDLAYTLSSRRSRLPFRHNLIGQSINSKISVLDPKQRPAVRASSDVNMTFVFTGQGAQWFAMGRELLGGSTVFTDSILRSEHILHSLGASWSLVDELNRKKSCSRVSESEIGQPSSTAIQVALVDLLADLDITPSVVVGHSSGEIVAAYAAGILSHESAMKISYHRSFLAKRCRSMTGHKGAMMAVGLGDEETNRYLKNLQSGKVVVACANSPTSTTVSGDEAAIDELLETLQQRAVFVRKLLVDTAYHSHHMQAVAESYLASLGNVQATAPSTDVKFFSSVTGGEKTEGFGSAYWVENLVSKVRFHEAIASAFEGGARCASAAPQIFLEVGPHHALAGPMRDTLSKIAPKGQEPTCLPSLLRGTHAIVSILESCGQLFEKGYDFNVNKLNYLDGAKDRPRLVTDLAPYAWDHSTLYWLEGRLSRAHRQRRFPQHELLGLRIPGTSPTEPAWRHFLNAANMPWLLEHVIDGYPIFPASGYITMAIEAKKQLSEERGIRHNVVNYVLKDLMFVKPLTIPDSPATVEIQISLRSTRRGKVTNWETFVVSSVTPDGAWSEHATGSIMTELKPSATAKSSTDAESAFSNETEVAQLSILKGKELQSMSGEELYDYMASKGNLYGPTFSTVSEFSHDAVNAVGHLTLPDTARNMPAGIEQPYVIHPGPLDALLHTSIPLFFENCRAESVMAVELEKVVISANGLNKPGTTIDFLTTLTSVAPSSANMQVSAFATNDEGEKDLVFRIANARLKGTAGNNIALDGSIEHDQTYTISWHEDVDLILPGRLDSQVPDVEAPEEKFRLLNQASSLFIRSCLQEISESDVIPKYKAFYRWMQRHAASKEFRDLISHLATDESAKIMKRLESMDAESQTVLRVGQKLGPIVKGKEEMLAPTTEDKSHFDTYTDDGAARCYLYLLEFVKSVAFKKPKLRILEIGAGFGGATKSLLDGLCKEWYASIDRYDYTDVSPSFFEGARERFRKHSSIMRFQELDIGQDPVEQGFSLGAYDLVIAANSIHVAPRIDDCLENARSLLKPGGRLLLVENTRVAAFSNMTSGPSANWFCGVEDGPVDSPLLSVAQWNRKLARNRFCGVEFSRNDFDGYAQRFTFIVAQATEPAQTRRDASVQIIVSPRSSAPHLNSVQTFVKALATNGQSASVCTLPVESLDDDSIYLIADDRSEPILANTTEHEWASISSLLNHTGMKLMWVTLAHELVPPTKCEYGLALGLCRSARTENSSLKVVNVNMAGDSVSKDPGFYQKLARIIHKSFLIESAPELNEYEVQINNGRSLIPRMQPNETFNQVMKRAAGFDEPELTLFHQDDRPLKLSVERPGLLDSMVFVDDERASTSLPACEVEVRVEALGVNFKDVMLAIGQIDESIPMAGEFAGVVTAVGNDFEHRFNIGDRVCGLNATPYASHARTHGDNIHHCPSSMTFAECASVPVAFATAYHCLVNLAKLEPGQTVLIHAASGGVGQAAISIAKHIGAEIFVTGGTEPKTNFLMDHFDIPKDHIFTSRSRLFKTGLMRMTQNRGVDVVLNSLSEDLLDESLDCVARFGSFLEIGKYDINRKHAISLAPFDKAIQFFSVDLTAICQYRPHVTNRLLTSVMRHLTSGAYKLLGPIKTLPLSKIEEAFRLLQGGRLFGKIVLEAGDEEKIIATPKRNAVADFAHSGTFVIAGGLGGLGLEVGRHLATRGAKHVALLSRRDLAVEKSGALRDEFRALGAEIYLVQCDIADASSQSLLREQLKTAPPVETIIQSAMVTDDQSIEQMSLGQFSKTQPSKIDGSRNLLEAFAGSHLKQMIMFSSCAGTFGGMRASNYAAANAAQDAFAVDQHQGTARVITIDLGPMKDVGVLSQQSNLVEKIAAQGFVAWGTDELFALLDSILDPKSLKEPPRQLLVGFTKESMGGAIHMHNIGNPILKYVLQNKTADAGEDGTASTTLGIKAAMENAADIQEATSVVRQQLAKKISLLSATELEAMTEEIPLSSFALDSLVLVELKNWIGRTFSASLQSTEISDATSLTTLSELIASRSKLVKQQLQSSSEDSEDSGPETKSESQDDSSSTIDTHVSETEFPKQPLPKLSESVEQYLAEVKLICSPIEFEATREKALDLVHTSGPKYQAQLQKAANDPDVENWFSDLYARGNFLRERNPLLGRSSFFASQPVSKGYEAVDVAVSITLAAFAYKKNVETGQSQARYLVDNRIDMSAEQSIYNAFRKPCLGEDRMVKHHSHDYIVVLRRGYAFQVMLQASEVQSSAADLKATFKAILDVPLESRSSLAALTADGRDDWAQYRDHLSSISETNAASLQTIEASAFVICFDEAIPDGPGQRARQFFCGDHHTNRWYDKTMQFIICPDGSAASLLGHTLLDGTSLAPLREFMLPRMQEELENPAPSSLTPAFNLATSFTLLPFDTDQFIENRIHVVQAAIAEMQDASSFDSFVLSNLGNDFWRAHRIPPKSGMQVLLQLAVHMHYGYNAPTTETVSLARYRRGRSALTHTVSPQVKAFCDIIIHGGDDGGGKARTLFLDAVAAHNASLVHAAACKLPRTNLSALQWVAEEMGETAPALFADKAWEHYSSELVTVDCLESDFEECGLLQHEERVWVHFQTQQHRALFSVCARPSIRADEFRVCVESAVEKVRTMLSQK